MLGGSRVADSTLVWRKILWPALQNCRRMCLCTPTRFAKRARPQAEFYPHGASMFFSRPFRNGRALLSSRASREVSHPSEPTRTPMSAAGHTTHALAATAYAPLFSELSTIVPKSPRPPCRIEFPVKPRARCFQRLAYVHLFLVLRPCLSLRGTSSVSTGSTYRLRIPRRAKNGGNGREESAGHRQGRGRLRGDGG